MTRFNGIANTDAVLVQHGVPKPVPVRRKKKLPKWPFYRMTVGDSFYFPIDRQGAVKASLYFYMQTTEGQGKKFSVLYVNPKLYGCWRDA